MLPWLPRLALFLGLLLLAGGPAAAQDAMVLPAPNPEEICTLGSSDIDTHHHVTSALHAGADAFATASPSSTFEVTFVEGGCGSWPQEAIDAVTFATEIWSHHLSSDIPIRVEATWDASLPSGTLGSAGPRAIISDASLPPGVGRPNTWYPIAQASAMAETDFVAQFDLETDIRMRLNCNRDNWYFGTDAAPPAGTIDFVTVVLHELGHGIGFLGTMSKEDDVAEAGWGRPTNAGDVLPLAYDVFAEDTAATRLIDEAIYPNPSEALFDALRSGAVFAGGTEARTAYGDERPPLFAPSTWQPGSSFSHLDTDTFTGTENALMRHQIDRASAVHAPGPVFCGMLADMAWPLGGGCTDELGAPPALTVTPDVLDFSVVTEGSAAMETVSIENTTSSTRVTGEVQVNGTDFTGLDGTGAFTLEAGEVLVVAVEFAPSAPEQRSGEIRITHDAATPGSPFTASLTGEGKPAPRVANPVPDVVLQLEDAPLAIDVSDVFSDVGPAPTYAASSEAAGVAAAAIDGATLTLNAEGAGTATINLTVDDGTGGTAVTSFVAEVNRSPVVDAPIGDQLLGLTGEPRTIDLSGVFSDPDLDPLQFEATSSNPTVATASVQEAVLTVDPLLPGEATITVDARDTRGGSTADAFTATITERQPPVVTEAIQDQTFVLGGAAFTVDLDTVFESPEGDALTYGAAADPSTRLTLGLNGSLLTVTAMQTGPATVTTTATDEAGASVADTFEVSVDAFTVTVQRSFDDATDAAHYRLVALPGAVDLDIAETLPGTTPGTSWRAFRDTGSEGSDDDSTEDYLEEYRTNSADFRFQPGRGFWLLSTVDWTFDAVLDAAQPDPDGDVHVPLHAGWNIISNPTSLDLAWADVLSHNAIDERLWRWDDGAWADLTADTLRSARAAGEAFYFFNAGGANALETLRLPTAPSEEATLQAPALTEVPTFTLTLTQAGQPVSHVRLGQATEERTYAAPPAAFGSTRLALHGERPLAGRLYEALQDRAVDLTVTAAPGTDLTLTAADLPAVLGSQEAVLLEPSTGRRHDLRRTAEVPLRITAEETPLRLLLGSPAFIDDAAPPPPDLLLTRLYPNPSAGAVTIEFSLPEALPIQLEVFDVLGRQVARLHEGALGPGTHSIIWNGLLTHGSPAASGVYLVRLHAGGETRTKRLTRVP